MNWQDRRIAFTDIETTGLEPFWFPDNYGQHPKLFARHEICEIGLVVASQPDLEIIARGNIKIKIERPRLISPEAKRINGYNEKDWECATSLEDALRQYNNLTNGAIFAAHNVAFDWGFMKIAFTICQIQPALDYHRIDLLSYALAVLQTKGYCLTSYRLNDLAKFLGLPQEPLPHRALNGAMLAYQVYKTLRTLESAKKATPYQANPFDIGAPVS